MSTVDVRSSGAQGSEKIGYPAATRMMKDHVIGLGEILLS